MIWSDTYIGLPEVPHGRDWFGCDCWGLVVLIYAHELGVALTSYQGAVTSTEEYAEVAALVAGEAENPCWRQIPHEHVRPFDVLVFRRGRQNAHLGVAVDHASMVHMSGQARREPFTTGQWAPRLVAVYRHVSPPLTPSLKGAAR